MRKQFSFGQNVSISYYSTGSSSEDTLYTFEARNGRRLELARVTTKKHIAALLNNGFRGSQLRFEGVDSKTQKFFKQCAGIKI